jgi:iron complex outermembrane receptor protein
MQCSKIQKATLLCAVGTLAWLNWTSTRAAAGGSDTTAAGSADAAEDPGPQRLEEVIVTARKREEPLQKTPAAVTAFSAKDLAAEPIRTIGDIQYQTPNLQIRGGSYDPFAATVAIRGQYPDDSTLTSQPSVGIYIDDVYQATTGGIGAGGLSDVNEVEVLKGPQGTLYGRNSTGGAVKINTPLPDYEGISGWVKGGYGNFNSNEEAGAVNLPVINDKLAVRISAENLGHDGYGHIIGTTTQLDDLLSTSGRIAVRINPIDNLQILIRGDVSASSSNGLANNLVEVTPYSQSLFGLTTFGYSPAIVNEAIQHGDINITQVGTLLFYGRQVASNPAVFGPLYANTLAALDSAIANGQGLKTLLGNIIPGGSFNAYSSLKTPHATLHQNGGSVSISYDVSDNLTVKSISAYRTLGRITADEFFGTQDTALNGTNGDEHLNQQTEELQASGRLFDSRLNYTAGYYYYRLSGSDNTDSTTLPALNTLFGQLGLGGGILPSGGQVQPALSNSHLLDTSHSAYTQASYAIVPNVNLTGGLRYTSERLNETASGFAGPDESFGLGPYEVCLVPSTTPGVNLPITACNRSFPTSFSNVSYTAGLDWSPTDDMLVYAKTSTGFKSGGVNSYGDYNAFSPEKVTDYEIGIKSDWLEHRLRFNLAAFYDKYNDIQRSVFKVVNGNLATEVVNAASADISGMELETFARPFNNFELRTNLAYLHPKYNMFISTSPVPSGVDPATGAPFYPQVDLSHTPFNNVPKWKTSIEPAYTIPMPFGSLRSSVDYTYQSKIYFSSQSATEFSGNVTSQDGYGLWDARFALHLDKANLEIAAWARNIADKRYIVNAADVSGSLGLIESNLGPPRTYGAEFTLRF